jgi:hypothetical protein
MLGMPNVHMLMSDMQFVVFERTDVGPPRLVSSCFRGVLREEALLGFAGLEFGWHDGGQWLSAVHGVIFGSRTPFASLDAADSIFPGLQRQTGHSQRPGRLRAQVCTIPHPNRRSKCSTSERRYRA